MPVTEKALAAVRAFLPSVKDIKRPDGGYYAQWVEWDKEGEILRNNSVGSGCHGSFGSPTCHVALFLQQQSSSTRPWESKLIEANRAFVSWMCRESPWSVFVLNKDDLDELCNCGAIFDCDASGPKIAYVFAKTMRYTNEDTWRVPIWYELVSQFGVNPMMALIACSCLTPSWGQQAMSTHNSTLTNPNTIEELRAVLTAKFPTVSRPFKRIDGEGNPHDSFDLFYPCPKASGSMFYAKPGTLIQAPKKKQEKVSDGWGGYAYKLVAESHEDFANHLKQLTKEALKPCQKRK